MQIIARVTRTLQTAMMGLSVVLASAGPLQAANRYWVGPAGGNWSAAANWSETEGGAGYSSVPGAGNTAIFSVTNTNAIVDTDFGGGIGAVDIRAGYTGAITQKRDLNVAGTFSLAAGATWNFDAGTAAVLNAGAHMTVNGTIECQRASTDGNGVGRHITVGGDLTIGGAGKISADGMGFDVNSGPNNEGLHGGTRPYSSGVPYGSLTAPVSLGSGAAHGGGGGAIRLTVDGALRNDNLISADGSATGNYTGAGGSVFITAGRLEGIGTIRARGGDPSPTSWFSGSGGRISVVLTDSDSFAGQTITARGGNLSGSRQAGMGTIVLKGTDTPHATLYIRDGTSQNPATDGGVRITSNVTDTVVGSVVIETARGCLTVDADQTLTVHGDWLFTGSGVYSVGIDSTVEFAGTNTATIAGATTFSNFKSTVPGKTLRFTGGQTVTVINILTLRGGGVSAGERLVIESTSATEFYLTATADSMTQDVRYVKVSDSNAGGGSAIVAFDSIEGTIGSTINWAFGAETINWQGNSSTAWNTVGNWNPARLPTYIDDVVIPHGKSRYPGLDMSRNIGSLTLESGDATLTLNGMNLTILRGLTNAGTITASVREIITVGGDCDFSGGTFIPAFSTLRLAGTGSRNVEPDGKTFYRIEVTTAVTNTWLSGLFARQFYCRVPGAGFVFDADSTFAVGDFHLLGAPGNPVVLRSAAPGTKWLLNVSGLGMVRHVDAEDSNASGGRTVMAIDSAGDDTSNPNWDFGDWFVWAGGTDSDFTRGANWAGGTAPGVTGKVLVDGGYDHVPIIAVPATIADLAIGFDDAATLQLDADLAVTGDAAIYASGAVLRYSVDTPADFSAGHNLSVYYGTIECRRTSTDGHGVGRHIIVGGDLTIGRGGMISADGMGFVGASGPGNPGVHAGTRQAGSGVPYGSLTAPVSLGSGAAHGDGGGAIRLTVDGALINDNLISADGSATGQDSGAGGSVLITAGSLGGIGTLRARGGFLSPPSGYRSGSGGRISVVLTDSASFAGQAITAQGGFYSQYRQAGMGTIVLKGTNTPHGTLYIRDGTSVNRTTDGVTRITPNMTDKAVGSVVIETHGCLTLDANETLTVNGDWERTGLFSVGSGSTVQFAGTDAVTILSDNTWENLKIATPGKVVSFEAGKTQTIVGTPIFDFHAKLKSTVDGSYWNLRKSGGPGLQEVGRVFVQDSHAGNPAEHLTFLASGGANLGNNVNWGEWPPKGTLMMLR